MYTITNHALISEKQVKQLMSELKEEYFRIQTGNKIIIKDENTITVYTIIKEEVYNLEEI